MWMQSMGGEWMWMQSIYRGEWMWMQSMEVSGCDCSLWGMSGCGCSLWG